MDYHIHIDTISIEFFFAFKEAVCQNSVNEFYFWNVHGIMNTLGLLQSK